MAMANQQLLRDFIEIPESMSDSDLVLELASGVGNAAETLREYVITESLVDNFDEALTLIRAAVTGQRSKAAYLHGSFGSGKSHFMAVLHALLHGERAARERPEFAGLIAKHDWLDGKRFLLVPFQMLGAKSLEQRVFGHYIEYVRRLHPEAPIPAVHRTDALLDQMANLRERIGDEQFIAGLPGGDEGDEGGEEDEWGESTTSWTTERLDDAFAGAYDDLSRRRLVGDLLTSWAKGFFRDAKEDAEAFVSLDAGLKEISGHARDLGYDSLVLFLDELILWLVNSAGDQQFVTREMQKVTNFVESGDPDRPAPVVSFIARQRDLREALGEQSSGAAELRILDTLDLAKARFDTITLEDRNLPVIAQERVLRPRDAAAGEAVAKAFERTTKLRQQVFDVLLGYGSGGTGADIDAFRKTYPFSPAFMDTLVHLSAVLQRSRTALKLMRRLLIRRRDDLKLGDLVPLGDLYDVITEGGDEPFTRKLKVEFDAAQKLYETRLRPYLLDRYEVGDDELARVRRGDQVDSQLAGRARAFTGDDRLMKTLLLAALAPTVPALSNLTAGRLAALNHGSVQAPIPGTEVAQVARKVEEWAGRFTEVKYVKADDPGVGLELVGVDVESVLETARYVDGEGARKNLIRNLVYTEIGVTETGRIGGDHFDMRWRGSHRTVEVVFGNVRDPQDLREDAFHPADPTSWRVIIDYPFDVGNFTAADDRNRLQALLERGFRARTVAWLPATLSPERIQDLRQLVVIDYVLQGHRFDEHAGHLNPTDRHRARQTLTAQRDVLRGKLVDTLREAYGLTIKHAGDVVTGFDDHLWSLDGDLRPRLASGGSLAEAMRGLADQMLAVQFPAHPEFDPDRSGATVKPGDARLVLDYVRRATETPDGRVEVEKPHRATMRRIANPLKLGEMHEAAFVLGSHWRQHFNQRAAQQGVTGDLRLSDLLAWIDQPAAWGLDTVPARLVVAAYAEQTDRAWVRHGGVLTDPPELNKITDDMALREQELPDEDTWRQAGTRAEQVFGHPPLGARRARIAAMFARRLSDDARRYRDDAQRLVELLEQHAATLRLDPDADADADADAGHGRLHTARLAADLLDGLGSQHGRLDVITRLAKADLGPAPERIGRSIKSAHEVTEALRNARWDNLLTVTSLPEPHAGEAERILRSLAEAAAAEELTTSLASALGKAGKDAGTLVRRAIAPPPPRPPVDRVDPVVPVVPVPPPPPGGKKVLPGGQTDVVPPDEPAGGGTTSGARNVTAGELAEYARELAAAHPGATFEISWRVVERS